MPKQLIYGRATLMLNASCESQFSNLKLNTKTIFGLLKTENPVLDKDT